MSTPQTATDVLPCTTPRIPATPNWYRSCFKPEPTWKVRESAATHRLASRPRRDEWTRSRSCWLRTPIRKQRTLTARRRCNLLAALYAIVSKPCNSLRTHSNSRVGRNSRLASGVLPQHLDPRTELAIRGNRLLRVHGTAD